MRWRRGHSGGLLSLAVGLLLCGCGGGDEPGGPAALAPPDAPLFAEVELEPGDARTEALEAMIERVAGVDDPAGRVIADFDDALATEDVSYADDVEPWIGSRAGLFVRSFEPSRLPGGTPDLAIAVEAADVDRAREFVADAAQPGDQERTYRDTKYSLSPDSGIAMGIVGDYVVLGTEPSVKVAVDSYAGESLGESDEFEQRTAELDEDRLATVFVAPGAALEAALMAEDVDDDHRRLLRPLLSGPLGEPMAAGVSVAEESASVEVVAAYRDVGRERAEIPLDGLPARAWLAVSAPELGPALTRLLDEVERGGLPGAATLTRQVRRSTGIDPRRDVLRWLGGAAGYIEGTGMPATFGVIAETAEPEGPRRLLAKVQALAERETGIAARPAPGGAGYGFSLGAPPLGTGFEAGVQDGLVAIVLGGTIAGAIDPDETLASEDRYSEAAAALGEDYEANLFMRIPSALEMAATGDPDDPTYPAAAPYVEQLDSLLGGVRVVDDQVVSRWTLTFAPQ